MDTNLLKEQPKSGWFARSARIRLCRPEMDASGFEAEANISRGGRLKVARRERETIFGGVCGGRDWVDGAGSAGGAAWRRGCTGGCGDARVVWRLVFCGGP